MPWSSPDCGFAMIHVTIRAPFIPLQLHGHMPLHAIMINKRLATAPTQPITPFLSLSMVVLNAKQKHPGCKKSARPIRSSIANRYVQPKTLISVEAKKFTYQKSVIYLNDV